MSSPKRRVPRKEWSEVEFTELLETVGGLSHQKAGNCAFQVRELLECCAAIAQRFDEMARGLKALKKDAIPLYQAVNQLPADFQHLRWHISDTNRAMKVVKTMARRSPPLRELNDDEVSKLCRRASCEPTGQTKKITATQQAWTTSSKKKV